MPGTKIIIGQRDRIDLPQLGYSNIKAKIDTGAYGSVIHCCHIEIVREDGKEKLSFELLDPGYPGYKGKKYVYERFRDKKVKNSGGETEHRYFIVTDVIVFGMKIEAEFSLTDRSQMKYPVLLGRKFLRKRFLVDVSLRDLSYKFYSKK
ncbi:MAG: RimK/LysX family protein [Bacteroidota bacterium]